MDLVGDEGIDVIMYLTDKESTDEDIAEKTNLKLNTVRRILYKLYDYRLASYIRTKDKEIGWYIYTWKLDLTKVEDIIGIRHTQIIDELNKRLEYESNNVFFTCQNDGTKLTFDNASETDFKCPHCQCVLEYVDNQENIMNIQTEIERLQTQMNNGELY